MRTYTFGWYTFTEGDLDLMAQIIREWNRGEILPSSDVRRKLTVSKHGAVRRWAESESIIGYGTSLASHRRRLVYMTSEQRGWRRFSLISQLPVEVLWRLVKPMLRTDGATGFSVTAHEAWLDLNVYPRRHRFYGEDDRRVQEDVLFELATHRYITFQALADVWEIRECDDTDRWYHEGDGWRERSA